MSIFDFVGGIFKPIFGIIDKVVPDADKKLEAKQQLVLLEAQFRQQIMEHEAKIVSEQASVIRAEVSGDGILARNWRPITMLVFVAIIANNFVIAPYVAAFGGSVPTLDIPNGMWALLNVGIGGYVLSRGAEKAVKNWKNGNGNGERG